MKNNNILIIIIFCLSSCIYTFGQGIDSLQIIVGKKNIYYIERHDIYGKFYMRYVWNEKNRIFKMKQTIPQGNPNEIPLVLPNYILWKKERLMEIVNKVFSKERLNGMLKFERSNIFITYYFLPKGKIMEAQFMFPTELPISIFEIELLEERIKKELSFIPDVKCFDDDKYRNANFATLIVKLSLKEAYDYKNKK